MKQWFTCSNLDCSFKSEEYPKETKIKEMEDINGTHCQQCGNKLIYNAS